MFAKRPDDEDLKIYESRFHLEFDAVKHPLGCEFFDTNISSFEAVAKKLKSPAVRSKEPGLDLESDVSLARDLKGSDF